MKGGGEMEDEQIIRLFFERNQEGITQLSQKYGRLCNSVAYNILHSREDAEECVNDAYLGVWNCIPPQHPKPLSAFLCKIVRNISVARYHFNTAEKRSSNYGAALSEIEELLPSAVSAEEEYSKAELTRIISEFLDTLSKENRVIFMRRYWFCDSYSEIAKAVGISEKNVSVKLVRIRRKLREKLNREGVTL